MLKLWRQNEWNSIIATLGLPLGFAGGLFDPDTGLTRFIWRDYDADTGRFTALDPLGAKGGDTDWYGYCPCDEMNRAGQSGGRVEGRGRKNGAGSKHAPRPVGVLGQAQLGDAILVLTGCRGQRPWPCP
jgi:RHS repeat-associated protein